MTKKARPFTSDEELIPGLPMKSSPGRTLSRVYAALAGEIGHEILEPDELAIFEDLFVEREMYGSTPARAALAAKMYAEGGYYGEDDQGRIYRTLPGGGVQFLDELAEGASESAKESSPSS